MSNVHMLSYAIFPQICKPLVSIANMVGLMLELGERGQLAEKRLT